MLGVDLLSIGTFEPQDGSYQVVEREADGRLARFVFHDGCLVGSILLGDTSAASGMYGGLAVIASKSRAPSTRRPVARAAGSMPKLRLQAGAANAGSRW